MSKLAVTVIVGGNNVRDSASMSGRVTKVKLAEENTVLSSSAIATLEGLMILPLPISSE